MNRLKLFGGASALVLFAGILLAQDETLLGSGDMDALNAMEAFRVGTEAYNRWYFNEAILSFEKALSYRPGEGLILDHLGKAYYRSGLEEIALREWQAAARAYGLSAPQTMLINNRIEVVRNRRSLFPNMNEQNRFVEVGRFPGSYASSALFSQPSSVLKVSDGSSWIAAYGSNEIVRLDVNGIVRDRRRGAFGSGFDRPYDIERGLDGRLYVSEFMGGRISVLDENGAWLSFIGSKGIHEGGLLGPSSLAVDDEGYIYVVDYGNRRISKFSPDGEFITVFGKKNYAFKGFISPTGIAFTGGVLYAADGIAGIIHMFDKNGLYLGELLDQGLSAPESVKATKNGELLVADSKRIMLIDPQTAIVKELTPQGNERVRIIGAGTNVNGSILAADFDQNEVTVLSSLDNVAGGLFVQIERIAAAAFPAVTLEISVQDRMRSPVAGLDANNFIITENGNAVMEQTFLGAGLYENSSSLCVLIERSGKTAKLKTDIETALKDINAASEDGKTKIASIVSAGIIPVNERFNAENPASLSQTARGGNYSALWRFDLGLRLAAGNLLPLSKRRAVVFLTSGDLGEAAYDQYDASQLASYLANNGVIFYAVMISAEEPDEALSYICRETGGEILYLYRAQGITSSIKKIAENPVGTYVFSYRSSLPTDFGRAFLPVETEVYLLERSGRDAAGYFAPFE
ncbi:MAG: NHL repeat-containing protein [Spirochaetaceae bacterium]|jgi:DNA-binding beta-propeller fold protein YncE|nr:NHL repeat-containing protein [Spirochaetaceae bacterium]